MAKEIIIQGYIGNYGYSKQYIRAMLKGESEVNVILDSLGGAFDHALSIHDQFAEHGNVNVEMVGFNASSSTIIALGAKYTKISENGFYLIHKVASWVNEWGHMNEDELKDLIKKLETEKDENVKMTLRLANMYSEKTGKDVKDILNLMKKATWLTAEEANQWGFVDEVFKPSEKTNLFTTSKVAMLEAAGFPVPEHRNNFKTNKEMEKEFINDEKSFVAKMKELFGITPKENKTEKTPEQLQDEKITAIEKQLSDLKENKKEKTAEELKAEKIAKLETDLKDLQGEKKEEKTDEELKAEKIAKLQADLKELQGEKEEEKTAEQLKDEKIAALVEQVKNLGGSAAIDHDVAKDNDEGKSTPSDDLGDAVAEAKGAMEYLNSAE